MKRLIVTLVLLASVGSAFAWNCTGANSYRFQTADGTKYALCLDGDELGDNLMLMHDVNGQWWAYGPWIDEGVTSQKISSYGTVSAYLVAKLEKATAQLHGVLNAHKPPPTDKVGAVRFDIPRDVGFDQETNTLKLNKQPPLSHAR